MKKNRSYVRNISLALFIFATAKKLIDISFAAYRKMKKPHKVGGVNGKE